MIDSIQGVGEMLKRTPRILFQPLDGDAGHYDKECRRRKRLRREHDEFWTEFQGPVNY